MSSVRTPALRGAAKNRDGVPCGKPSVDGAAFCCVHAPERAAARAAARKARGRRRHATATIGATGHASAVTLAAVGNLRAMLKRTVADTFALANSPQRDRTFGTLAGVALLTLEVGELEDRIAALEQRLTGSGPRRSA